MAGKSWLATAAAFSNHAGGPVAGALLVAPGDVEGPNCPPGTVGFIPMPLSVLPFPTHEGQSLLAELEKAQPTAGRMHELR